VTPIVSICLTGRNGRRQKIDEYGGVFEAADSLTEGLATNLRSQLLFRGILAFGSDAPTAFSDGTQSV
jgi:hypothetical protein